MENMTNDVPQEDPRVEAVEVEPAPVSKNGGGFWKRFFGGRKHTREIRELDELPKFSATVQPAMERLTDELIAEVVGPEGELTRAFREQIAGFSAHDNPIDQKRAKAIMMSMLDLAASKRKLLNERLERSVEVGELYNSYYGRVHAVTTLAAQAHTDLERMDLAEEDFRYNYGVLMNVRDKSLLTEVHPKNQLLEKVLSLRLKMNTRHQDIMRELDERGGG